MMKRFASITLTLLLAGCMTPGQKRAKANAESAVSTASSSVASVRQAGGDASAGSLMRSADDDLQMAQDKLRSGNWEEARRYARLVLTTTSEVREKIKAGHKSEKVAPTASHEESKTVTTKKQQPKPKVSK